MAATARPASFLPSIKCSDCGIEIEISKMADHVCSTSAPEPAAPAPPPKATKSFFDRAAHLSSTLRSSSSHLKLGRSGTPSQIDSNAANKPFSQVDPLTPISNPTTSRSPSPAFPKSPNIFRKPSALVLRAHSPPSPDLMPSQDSAFPSRPSSPEHKRKPSHNYPESDPNFAPLSPRPNGDSFFQRMNAIAPGPFDGRERKPSLRPEAAEERPGSRSSSSHRRTPTFSSLRSRSKSRTSSRSSNVLPHHERQPSVAGSEKSRISIRSNGQSAPSEAPQAKRGPPPRPARPDENVDTFLEQLQGQNNTPSLAGVSMRPVLSPIQKSSNGTANKAAISLPRRPSEAVPPPPPKAPAAPVDDTPEWWDDPEKSLPQSPPPAESPPQSPQSPPPHQRKPSVAQDNAKRYPRRTSSRNISIKDLDLGPAPPVPQTAQLDTRAARGASHAPSDSASSEDSTSSAYDGRSNSSRSTPPTSAGSSPTKSYRPFDKQLPSGPDMPPPTRKMSNVGLNGPRPGTSQGPPPESHRKTPSMSRRNPPPEPLAGPLSPPRMPPVADAPESPMDPAIQRGLFTPRRPSDASALPEIQSVVQNADAPPVPPVPAQEEEPIRPVSRSRTGSLGKRPGTAGKGSCRGCGEAIVGKSVKAADGRLTGRWHKQCFVCRTCRAPFQTADFYVIDNHPYCAHHYHQLNGSLCRACNYGIEGQYLETERRQKFHPQCFSCDTCRMPLRDDYFEVMGVVYCERHAWHAARQTGGPRGMLAPGDPRRNPERRRTRLMMM